MRVTKLYGKELLMKELRKSYNFFMKEINLDEKSKGYGLIRDKTLIANDICSIASVRIWLSCTNYRRRT